MLRIATARVAAPSVCFAAARILAGRGPNSSSLFPPLAAVVAVAPNEGRLWQPGEACWIRQRLPY